MNTVRELIDSKGEAVWSVAPDAPVFEALSLMAEKNIGAVVVLEGDTLAGILSERDYARKVILRGRSSRETPVREIMTAKVTSVGPDESLESCMEVMTARRIRHLPILEGDRVRGVISLGDVVEVILSNREKTIGQLERYITGSAEIP